MNTDPEPDEKQRPPNSARCQRCGIAVTCLPGEEGPIRWLYRHWLTDHYGPLGRRLAWDSKRSYITVFGLDAAGDQV